ncbi:MAG: Malate dehydrogenase, partial [uncultured Rubrobacteraceae bacterium]
VQDRHRNRRRGRYRVLHPVPDRLGPASRTRREDPAEAARDRARAQGGGGHRDGAPRLRLPPAGVRGHYRRRVRGLRRHQRRDADRRQAAPEGDGARRPPGGERGHLQAPGRGHKRGRRRRRPDTG